MERRSDEKMKKKSRKMLWMVIVNEGPVIQKIDGILSVTGDGV